MFYILEGPDGSGKTSLAKKLQQAHPGAPILHFGAPANEEEAYAYWQTYMRAIKDNAHLPVVIIDRCWYSDMVYGPVMRGKSEMSGENAENLELAIIALGGGIVLYCTGKPEMLWKRCKERGEAYIKTYDTLKQLHAKYEEVMQQPWRLPIVRYDTTVRW